LVLNPHQFWCQYGGQFRAVLLHKIMHSVTDTEALHLHMRTDISPGSHITFPPRELNEWAQIVIKT